MARLVLLLWLVATAAAASPPRRIVSLAPSITEILFALGVGDSVVGVSDYCAGPEAALRLPRVGGVVNANLERIVALAPDLLLTIGEARRLRPLAAAESIPFRSLTLEAVADVGRAIREVGALVGAEARAQRLAADLDGRLAAVRERWVASEPIPTLLVLSRPAGRLFGLMTCNRTSFLSELLTIAGGRNCFADGPGRYLTPGLERIVQVAPAVIIEVVPDSSGWAGGDRRPPLTPLQERRRIAEWEVLSSVPAVRDHRVRVVTNRHLLIPSLHLAETAEALAAALHRDLPIAGATGPGAGSGVGSGVGVRRAPPRPPRAAPGAPARARRVR